MKHLDIPASKCEAFKKVMHNASWVITHQDVGQTELVGYGYIVIWQKEEAKVILHYSDRQGIAQAKLEVTSNCSEEISHYINQL